MYFRLTVNNTREQNGIAEGLIQSVTQTAQCPLLLSDFPAQLWGEAVRTTAYCFLLLSSNAAKMKILAETWRQ